MRLKIAIQKSGRLTESSLDLLSRCGLKFSRGKDQLMCYGENMPLDVLFVRDDDIPDLVQEDVCDLGLVGLNVVEEKRLAFAARGSGAALRDRAAARFRTLQAVHRGAGRLRLPGGRLARRQAHRDHLPEHPVALPRGARHRGGSRGSVGRGGNRPAAGAGRRHLRSGVHRIDARGESPAAGRGRHGEPGRIDPHARSHSPGEAGLDPPPAHADRRRRGGQGQQVHHAARAPLGPRRPSRASCPAAKPPRSYPWKDWATGLRCMRFAARASSGNCWRT